LSRKAKTVSPNLAERVCKRHLGRCHVITGVSKIVINIEDLDANDRAVGSVAITGSACRYNDVAVDGNRSVLRRVCAGHASRVEAPIRIGLAHHDATTASRPTIGSS
jgi:hypothetical protein